MFPLDFPLAVLRRARPGAWVLDPFCGRGTTNLAGRLLDLPSAGIDSSPVAAAIARAKLANTTPAAIMAAAGRILEEHAAPRAVPEGEFWELAFERSVLHTICRLREGLLRECRSEARQALRAILMGALHGPRPRGRPSYLSNQAPRTYAPKPRYAVTFWRARGLQPERVDVLDILRERAARYYGAGLRRATGAVILGDSCAPATFTRLPAEARFEWIVTSPPYYGMRTYIPDQWLRGWLVGGPPRVDYSMEGQLRHGSPEALVGQLREAWRHAAAVCTRDARMVVRFGGINDRRADPLAIIEESFRDSGWAVTDRQPAGAASAGRRQANHFARTATEAIGEHDIWALREG